ncbi:E3 ubiquitin-protein ligase RFI2 [Cardamine amara subsp. amara]|uniref:E3 ubiquitin-protein ligase RFI2 n=1 Tax=Cardamine amara subsp. amara TaxID=228776 RepID=A0ABD1CA32_CARAN
MAGAEDDDRQHRRIASQSVDSVGKRGNEDSPSPVEVPCSICLELVVDDGTRSKAKLQCGHQFHLDCIGSAFNMKGAMQCPNCRNVEKGHWLYANGSTRPFPEFVMEDWTPEEDLYGLTYPEMQYRVHWCPFGELSQAASFEELEPATTTYPNDFHAHHAAAVNHSYLAYIGPGPAATPRTSDNNNTDDHPWNSHSNDHFHQLAVAPQYHHHHSPSFSLPGAHVVDGEPDSSAARGISYPHPFLFSHRSSPRTSPAINVHQGNNTQMREHLHTQHHVFNHQRQHHANGPLVSVTRRGLPPAPLPPPPMQDQNVGFFIYPPPGSSGGHHEPETDQFRAWERDWFPHFPVPSNHRTNSSFWQRHF